MLSNVVHAEEMVDDRLRKAKQEIDRLKFVTTRAFPLLAHYERMAFHPSVRCTAAEFEELQVAGDLISVMELKLREIEAELEKPAPDADKIEALLATYFRIRPPHFSLYIRMLIYSKFRLTMPLYEADRILERIFTRLQNTLVKASPPLPAPPVRPEDCAAVMLQRAA